jgi:very-short-patch-repair endonuclease
LGELMADILCCGSEAVASHLTAAGVLGIRPMPHGLFEVSVPAHVHVRPAEVTIHRRKGLRAEDVGRCRGIPVTSPVQTLVDIATKLGRDAMEAAINEADKLDLVDPESLRDELDERSGHPGVPALRDTLDRRTFTMTDTELERRFLRIARRAGLDKPDTQVRVSGFLFDFYWPDLGLVVETDGLRYHRTPAQQAKDHVRDQTHTADGLAPLRFTRAQVRYEPAYIETILAEVARRRRR